MSAVWVQNMIGTEPEFGKNYKHLVVIWSQKPSFNSCLSGGRWSYREVPLHYITLNIIDPRKTSVKTVIDVTKCQIIEFVFASQFCYLKIMPKFFLNAFWFLKFFDTEGMVTKHAFTILLLLCFFIWLFGKTFDSLQYSCLKSYRLSYLSPKTNIV